MLTVYSKETTSFSTLGIGVLKDFLSNPLITEELNGAYTLEFQYAKDGYLSEYLIEQNIIKANGQPFRIWNVKKDMQKITILAKHIFFDLSFNFLSDVYPKNLTAQSALEWLLNRAAVSTNFSVTGNCTATASGRYVRKTFIDAIFNEDNALLKRFGGELSYDNFNITVHEQRGSNANFSIRYKKNLTGIDFNLDFSNVATRIVPIGFDGLTIDSTYVESPKVNDYFTPLYKTYEFSDIKYDPDDEEAYHTLAEAKQALINAANELFTKNVDLPQISIGVNFVELSKCTEYTSYSNLETVHLGDTIDVIIPELNIHTSARVNKTVYDCILGRFITLEIGSAKQSVTRSQINVENQIRKSENYLTQAQQNAENLINHPFNGNVYIDKENGVIYLMDSTSPETAQNVWKWSLGGLGFSSTGINGTYTVAILQDGRINADFITTGQLDTGVIQGYDSLLIQVDTLDREFQKEINPTGVVSGSSITLEDSAETELIDFELEGKTTQADTPTPDNPSELESVGYKNLLANDLSTTQSNGITITNNGDGTYTLNGTATADVSLAINNNFIPLSGTWRMQGCPSGGSSSTYMLSAYVGYWGTASPNIDTGKGTNITYTGDVKVRFYIKNGTTCDNLLFKPMIVNDDKKHEFVPYGKYGIEVKITGKNLFDKDTAKINNNYTVSLGSSNYALPIQLEPNTQYNVSRIVSQAIQSDASFNLQFTLYENPSNAIFYLNNTSYLSNITTANYTFTTGTSGILYLVVRYGSDTRLSNYFDQVKVQLTKGTQATIYEEYKLNTYLYILDNPLRSIGNYKDKLYIKNGMLYVERKIGSVDLSTITWSTYGHNIENYHRYSATTIPNIKYVSANTQLGNGMAEKYVLDVERGITSKTNKIAIDVSQVSVVAVDSPTGEFIYELAEPYTEELGQVQMPSTYKGITHINTTDELEPNMSITYVRDTLIANYVESHVREIKITENGIEQRVQTIEEGDYGTRINAVEQRTTDTEHSIDIISTNIDTTTGEVRRVTTTTGFTFNEDGMSIEDSNSNFKALHRNTGTTYYDGANVVGQYTKDGSKQKDLDLFGIYTYGKNDINDTPMFIAQLFTDGNGEEGFGHFYNKG